MVVRALVAALDGAALHRGAVNGPTMHCVDWDVAALDGAALHRGWVGGDTGLKQTSDQSPLLTGAALHRGILPNVVNGHSAQRRRF
jgi:hypothetical protein